MDPSQRGFTLIELLIVVVIIGILASVAVPRFSRSKELAHESSMKADLRNIAVAQEAFLYDSSRYYGGSIPAAILHFTPTSGVTISLQDVTATGWAAIASHAGTDAKCALYVGTAPPLAPAVDEGAAKCQ